MGRLTQFYSGQFFYFFSYTFLNFLEHLDQCAKAIMWILKLILAILLFEITYSSSSNVKKTEQKKPSSSFMDWVNIFSEIKETETDVLQDEEKEPSVVIESEQLENDDKRERDPQRIDFRK